MKSEFHIPTIVALLILLIGLSSLIFLLENGPALLARGATTPTPASVTIANVTDREFSVAWATAAITTGLIEYTEQGLVSTPRLERDIRDGQKLTPRYTHLVTASALKPNATYKFAIVSGGKKFSDSHFTVTTGTALTPPTHALDPAFGTLLDSRNMPVDEALAFVSFEDSQILASVVETDGTWILPLGQLRSKDGSRYFTPRKQDEERLLFVGPDASATVIATTDSDSPLVPVRLGESYDLTERQSRRGSVVIAQAKSASTSTATVNASFQVLLPEENAAIPSGKPAVKGTGLSGKSVIVTLSGPSVTTGKVTVGTDGAWSWTPPQSLAPGKYTGTFVSFDEKNAPVTLARSFAVLKSGSQVLQAATPSASRSPSPTPRVSPTPRTATPSATASPSSQVPTTATVWPTLALLIFGSLIVLFGSVSVLRRQSP